MAYKVIILYQLYMPSYFLGTFTEYPYVEKYLQGATGTSTENRMRILRLIENITLGTAAVGYRTESMHGAGSPQAQRIMISRQGNLAAKKELAKVIAKVDESKDRK